MSTVTYVHQPGIHKTRGSVPLAGTAHVYTVSKLLWPKEVEDFIGTKLIGKTLHVCCGHSYLGDVRLDLYERDIDVRGDMSRLPFLDKSFNTVLIDPPYNSKFQVMHDMLNEIHRLARTRIIFQHWFSPVNSNGKFKKAHVFSLTELGAIVVEDDSSEEFNLEEKYAWMPRTYFGRMQFISVFDHCV